MKKISNFLRLVVTITTLLLSACGSAAATSTSEAIGGSVAPISVAFIGMVDSMAGDQWVINGQTVTVSVDAIQDGPFNIGDEVKVEGVVSSDGSFAVSNVKLPTPQELSSLPPFGDGTGSVDNSNSVEVNENAGNENLGNENSANENGFNENASNENEGNVNSSNENEGNANGNNENESNENSGNENESNENNSTGGGNENGNNENGGGENKGNENEGNESGGGENKGNENEGNDND